MGTRIAALLAAVAFILCIPVVALAETPKPQGLTVSPAVVNLQLQTGAKTAEASVSVRNDTNQALDYAAYVEGAELAKNGALVPTGGPDPLLEQSLTLSQGNFTLGPGQSINVKLRLEDAPTIPPGGHYAVLLISQLGSSTGNVSILPAIGVTLFIGKESGAVRKLNVLGIETDGTIFRLPQNITVTFKNEGNIDLVPRASTVVRQPDGRQARMGVLNESSVRAMPNHSVTLQAPVKTLSKSWMPGRYTVQVHYRYDNTDNMQLATQEIWYVPPASLLFVPLIGLIAYGCWLAGGFLLKRRRANARKKGATPSATGEKTPIPANPKPQSTAAPHKTDEHTGGVKSALQDKKPTRSKGVRVTSIVADDTESHSVTVRKRKRRKV
jgi:hypothetical protein